MLCFYGAYSGLEHLHSILKDVKKRCGTHGHFPRDCQKWTSQMSLLRAQFPQRMPVAERRQLNLKHNKVTSKGILGAGVHSQRAAEEEKKTDEDIMAVAEQPKKRKIGDASKK